MTEKTHQPLSENGLSFPAELNQLDQLVRTMGAMTGENSLLREGESLLAKFAEHLENKNALPPSTQVISLDPQTDPLWQRLVEDKKSSIFHSPAWLGILSKTYHLPLQALVLLDSSGAPTAGIPFCRLDDFRGKRLVSIPFSDFCDPIADEISQWNALFAHLQSENCPIIFRCLHNDIPVSDQQVTLTKKAKWHGLDLRPDTATLWQQLTDASKRQIKKADKEEVVVRPAENEDDLRAFFKLHLGIRKYKYKLLAQPYSFFENIWHDIIQPGQGTLLLAARGQHIIGSTLFLEWGDTLYYKFNASRLDKYRPNDLLIWEGIKYAQDRGLKYLDFGLSDWDQEGLVKYKRKYATDEKTISFLSHRPNYSDLSESQESSLSVLLPQLTNLLTGDDVPDDVTEQAGNLLYQYFV